MLKNLKKSKCYKWENVILFYDKRPEYGKAGWFISFDVLMGYKNLPLALADLPQTMQELIDQNVQEHTTEEEVY